jgi:hypothetical protein
LAESILILALILIALAVCIVAMSAVGQFGLLGVTVGGAWHVQLFRLVWYPIAWVVVLGLAAAFYLALAMFGESIAPWVEQLRRFKRARAIRPYLASIEKAEHRGVIGEIYKFGGAPGLHEVADAVAYPTQYGYLGYVAGFDFYSKGRSETERLMPPPVPINSPGGHVSYGADHELHAVVSAGLLRFSDGAWKVDAEFAAVLARALSAHPVQAGTWLRGASRGTGKLGSEG